MLLSFYYPYSESFVTDSSFTTPCGKFLDFEFLISYLCFFVDFTWVVICVRTGFMVNVLELHQPRLPRLMNMFVMTVRRNRKELRKKNCIVCVDNLTMTASKLNNTTP